MSYPLISPSDFLRFLSFNLYGSQPITIATARPKMLKAIANFSDSLSTLSEVGELDGLGVAFKVEDIDVENVGTARCVVVTWRVGLSIDTEVMLMLLTMPDVSVLIACCVVGVDLERIVAPADRVLGNVKIVDKPDLLGATPNVAGAIDAGRENPSAEHSVEYTLRNSACTFGSVQCLVMQPNKN